MAQAKLRSVSAAVLFAGLFLPQAASAQFTVDVVDTKTGSTIAANVRVMEGGSSRPLGSTREGTPLTTAEECDGQMVAVTPVFFSVYQAQNPQWQPCSEDMVFHVQQKTVVRASARLTTVAQARAQFEAMPTVVSQLNFFESSTESGNLLGLAISSKQVAEELEKAGFEEQAKPFWDISAQSAVTLMAQSQQQDASNAWLVQSGSNLVFTSEAREVIRGYQSANDLPAVGQIGPQTFESLESMQGVEAAQAAEGG